jgi:hypothetical protein
VALDPPACSGPKGCDDLVIRNSKLQAANSFSFFRENEEYTILPENKSTSLDRASPIIFFQETINILFLIK